MKTSKASELSEYLRENYPVNKASISQRKMKYGVGYKQCRLFNTTKSKR